MLFRIIVISLQGQTLRSFVNYFQSPSPLRGLNIVYAPFCRSAMIRGPDSSLSRYSHLFDCFLWRCSLVWNNRVTDPTISVSHLSFAFLKYYSCESFVWCRLCHHIFPEKCNKICHYGALFRNSVIELVRDLFLLQFQVILFQLRILPFFFFIILSHLFSIRSDQIVTRWHKDRFLTFR